MAGPEFARHVGPGLTRESDTGCCCTATGMESRLRDDTGSCMPRKFSHRGTTLSAFRAASDYGALQRMPEPGTKTPLGGTVIVQVFVKWSGDNVLNGVFYRVGRESRPQPFSEPCRACSIISWMAGQLSHSRPRNHAAQRSFAESGMFPVLPVRMRLLGLRHRRRIGCYQ